MADFISGSHVTLEAGDIEIGAVELKDSASDTRSSIIAGNSAAVPYWLATMPAVYNAVAPTLTDTFASPLQLDINGNLKVLTTGGVTDDSQQVATPPFTNVGGEFRAVDTVYTDGDATVIQTDINGYLKVYNRGYDAGTDSMKGFEVSPISTHHIEETGTLTNIVNATPQYLYYDMDGYKYASFQIAALTGVDTHTITLEGTNQDDGTAAASCTYQDVTLALTGVANLTAIGFWILDNPAPFKYLRIKDTTAGGNNDGDIVVYSKLMY